MAPRLALGLSRFATCCKVRQSWQPHWAVDDRGDGKRAFMFILGAYSTLATAQAELASCGDSAASGRVGHPWLSNRTWQTSSRAMSMSSSTISTHSRS